MEKGREKEIKKSSKWRMSQTHAICMCRSHAPKACWFHTQLAKAIGAILHKGRSCGGGGGGGWRGMKEDLFRLNEWGLEWRREDRGRKTRACVVEWGTEGQKI